MFVPRSLNNKRFTLGQYTYFRENFKSNKIMTRYYIQFDCCYELEPDRKNENFRGRGSSSNVLF